MKTQLHSIDTGLMKRTMKFFLSSLFLILSFLDARAQAPNQITEITTADGMGNNGCAAVLKASNGDLWVAHRGYSPVVPYNSARPISKRDAQGNWTFPDLSAAPAVTNNSFTYNSNANYTFDKIYEQSNGNIWFLTTSPNNPSTTMAFAPPIVMFDGNNWTTFHANRGNFPDRGVVLDIVETPDGNLWFGCAGGLVRMTPAGVTTDFNPPAVADGNQNRQADNIISVDYNNAGNVVMIASQQNTANGGSFLGWACVREFDENNNSWSDWHLSDANWTNAGQVYYQPMKVVAMRDASDRLYITASGGGLYYIDNGNFASNAPTHIASFHQGWSHPGVAFDNVITNLPDWTSTPYRSKSGRFWVTAGSAGSPQNGAYRFEARRPANWGGVPGAASHYAFGRKQSNLSIVSAGQTYKADINDISFGSNDAEIWFATEQGLELWYADYPNPNSDFIGIEGAGTDNRGVVGFNSHAMGLPEPQDVGHVLPIGTPTISIDTAYYYIASSDYDNMDPNVDAGLQGDGTVQGFPATAAALTANNLDWDDLQISFTPIDLGDDVRGDNDDWQYNSYKEWRRYDSDWIADQNGDLIPTAQYTISLDGEALFRGKMPLTELHIHYNKYGYLFDSIAALTDYTPLDTTNWLDDLCDVSIHNICNVSAEAVAIANALYQDVGEFGIRFNFRSIQSANSENLNNQGRTGGFFIIHKAMLEKGTVPMAPQGPMGGIVRVGSSTQADYTELQTAVRDLQRRGVDSWVQFRMEPGTYEGIFELHDIPGIDGFNGRYISFMSTTDDSTDVVVRKKPGRRDTNYVFHSNQDLDLRFSGITIENHEPDSCRIIFVESALSKLAINSCMIRGNEDSSATEEATLIYSDGFIGDFNVYHNIFDGGWNAMNYKANGEVRIVSNLFVDQQYYAIYINNSNTNMISQNRFEGPFTGRFYGVYANDINTNLWLTGNRFYNQAVPCGSAIHIDNNADPGSWNNGRGIKIFNNEISVKAGNITSAAALYGDFTLFYHNTISIIGQDSNAIALKSGFVWDDTRVQSNIFSTQGARVFEHTSWGGVFGALMNHNVYFSQNNRPFSLDLGGGVFTHYSEIDSVQANTGNDSFSLWADPMFHSDMFLLPMNAAMHNQAGTLIEVQSDILGYNRPPNQRDHGCYEYDSALAHIPCQGDINISAQRLDNFFIRINWSNVNAPAYRLYFRAEGAQNWRQMIVGDTSKVIGPLQLGTYEFYVTDRPGNLVSCTGEIVMDCEDFSYSTVVTQIRNVQNKGAVRVFGMDAGKRNWDIGLDNGTDTTWVQNRRAGAFSRLEAGTYFIHVRDRYGCYSSQVDTVVINAIDTTVIPVLTNLQRIGNNTLRPIWTVQDNANIDRYQVRVKDITGGAPGVLYGTYIVQGANATQMDIPNLPVGTYKVDVRARVNGTFQNSIYSRPRSKVIFQNKTGVSDDSDLLLGQATRVYPNPASDRVVVRSKAGSHVQILDMNGRILDELDLINEQVNLDVQDYAPGIYLIRVSTGSETYTERLIKR